MKLFSVLIALVSLVSVSSVTLTIGGASEGGCDNEGDVNLLMGAAVAKLEHIVNVRRALRGGDRDLQVTTCTSYDDCMAHYNNYWMCVTLCQRRRLNGGSPPQYSLEDLFDMSEDITETVQAVTGVSAGCDNSKVIGVVYNS